MLNIHTRICAFSAVCKQMVPTNTLLVQESQKSGDLSFSWLLQLFVGLRTLAVVGCADLTTAGDEGAPHWMERNGDLAVFGCNGSSTTWQLKCDGDQWLGDRGSCLDISAAGTIPPFSQIALSLLMMMITMMMITQRSNQDVLYKFKPPFLGTRRVVDDAKCIVVTRVCVSLCLCVCLSVRGRMPTLLHGPGCNLGSGRRCLLVVHCWADLQSAHGVRCCGNITRTRNVSEYMLVLAICIVSFLV